jgi:hypothetical protein
MAGDTIPSDVLSSLFPPDLVKNVLLPRERWRPYPSSGDRGAWNALPAEAKTQAVRSAEQYLGMIWPELPATLFLEFHRNGDRERFQRPYRLRRQALLTLVLGECVEGVGRFLDDIINGIWAICEESFWGVSAHNFSGRPPFNGGHRREHAVPLGLPDTAYRVIDLFAAETGALLAWTWYLLGARLAADLPVVPDRIERELRERILVPYRTIDTWWWLGKERRTNNWNPWIHSNVLVINLLVETDEAVRTATVSQIVAGLDAFLATYHSDGGCDEGTSYWGRAGGSLFDNLDLLFRASAGRLDAFDLPLVREIGRYIVRTHIGGSWYVNFADGTASITPNGDLIYRYGQRTGDQLLMQQGAFIAETTLGDADSVPTAGTRPANRRSRLLRAVLTKNDGALTRLLPAIFDSAVANADPTPPLVRDAWLDGIPVFTAREHAGRTDGLFVAAKGGSNAESHNHNDVGSFIVAVDGQPVLIDIGVETYTRKTFSAERYSIWTMRSGFHNLPVIDGIEQAEGSQFAARDVSYYADDDRAEFSLDIAGAFPQQASITAWRRTVRLERGAHPQVVLHDAFRLASTPSTVALHLMVHGAVDCATAGVIRCNGAGRPLSIHYERGQFDATVQPVAIDDERLGPVWGATVYRVVLNVREITRVGGWQLTMT